MSTFDVSLVLAVCLALAPFVVPACPQVAMARLPSGRRPSARPDSMAMTHHVDDRPTGDQPPVGGEPEAPRNWWNTVGFGYRDPEQPVVGPDAMVQWWERARSGTALVALVALLGLAMAATIGAFVFFVGFLLEQAVS